MNRWFTSDTHFGHEKVIGFTGRPWNSVEEMDEGLIENWNRVVKHGDIVYHCGDFTFRGDSKSYVDRLSGQIHLIRGNHDQKKRNEGFTWVGDYKYIKIDNQGIFLCHYPMRAWHNSHRGSWNLHGHLHGGKSNTVIRESEPQAPELILDIGADVDLWNYTPISFDKVRECMGCTGWTLTKLRAQLGTAYMNET